MRPSSQRRPDVPRVTCPTCREPLQVHGLRREPIAGSFIKAQPWMADLRCANGHRWRWAEGWGETVLHAWALALLILWRAIA
jgi:hypothetical protein